MAGRAQTVGQVGDRVLEALCDGREVLLVGGDQRRVGLCGEVVGEVESAGGQEVHGIGSDGSAVARPGDSGARPGACRKSPRALYVENGEAMTSPSSCPALWADGLRSLIRMTRR